MNSVRMVPVLLVLLAGCSQVDSSGAEGNSPGETRQTLRGGEAVSVADAAELYAQGRERFEAGDYAGSFGLWMKATEAGSGEGAYSVGRSYDYGQGVESDLDEARKWYRIAADRGNADGMYQVAESYVEGRGPEVDEAQAFAWMTMAADLNQPDALYMLGVMYVMGRGTEVEREKGMDLVAQAAKLGQPNAMKTMELYDMLPKLLEEQEGGEAQGEAQKPSSETTEGGS